MKQTVFFYTEPNLYLLNGNHKDEIILIGLAEKLKSLQTIPFSNGSNISIRIDAIKHKLNQNDAWPFLVINGLVHCRIDDENVLLTPEQALKILLENWYDYEITYEVTKE